MAYSVLRQQQDAEDVAQDVMTLAYQKCPSLRTRDRLRDKQSAQFSVGTDPTSGDRVQVAITLTIAN